MPIVHIVLFKFKEDTDATVVRDVCKASSIVIVRWSLTPTISRSAIVWLGSRTLASTPKQRSRTCAHTEAERTTAQRMLQWVMFLIRPGLLC